MGNSSKGWEPETPGWPGRDAQRLSEPKDRTFRATHSLPQSGESAAREKLHILHLDRARLSLGTPGQTCLGATSGRAASLSPPPSQLLDLKTRG